MCSDGGTDKNKNGHRALRKNSNWVGSYSELEYDLIPHHRQNRHYLWLYVTTGLFLSLCTLNRVFTWDSPQENIRSFSYFFLLGGAAQAAEPPGRKGGTPTLGWWHCPRRGARPFRERYAPPYLSQGTLCGPSG